MKVYYPYIDTDDWEYAFLQQHLDASIELQVGAQRPDPARYEILIEGRPSEGNITASQHLKALVIPWAGLPTTTRDLMQAFPAITVHNIHHNAVITAEMMLALLLAAAKFIVPVDRAFRQHNWTVRYQDEKPEIVLEGKTALILGYGSIGQRVARMLKGFDMTVLATKRDPKGGHGIADEIHPPEALHDLLPRANVLVICLPLTPETEGLIGENELKLLPEYAILVNAGRGPIVDEAALFHALRDGTLYAAGSDVWYKYPANREESANTPPSDYPFHALENVVMSPHRAGGSRETAQRRMLALADLLNTAARGEPLPNRIDLTRGY